ncbi:hypothetical protein Tco_0928402, partial [Tanacetum coccineum]
MSDSEDSTVTYTAAPPSPDYVPGLEEPEQAPPLLEFVPEPVYPEFMPPEDDVLPTEEQPLPAAVLPTADSPGYISKSDHEEDLEEDDDEDPEEDPTDYPTDRDNDDNEEEPSGDKADDEEEEHPALADFVPPPPAHRTTARISIPAHAPIPFLSKEESCYDTTEGQVTIYFSFITTTTTYHTLTYQGIYVHDESCCTIHLHLSISIRNTTIRDITTSTYIVTYTITTFLLPSTDRRADRPEVYLPPWERANYGFVATLDAKIRRDPERDVGYGITNTWDEMIVGMPGAPATDDTELGRQMTKFATMVRQDTYEFYGRLDEAQDARGVLSGRFNLLQRDRCSHSYTALLMEREAKLSREAWRRSMAASDAARYKVMALRTTVLDIGDNTAGLAGTRWRSSTVRDTGG